MELLLWALIILFGLAALVDNLMTEERIKAWRDSTRDIRRKIAELKIDIAITTANKLFCDLFDAIYGAHYWSLRRFVGSYLSSLLAVGTATLLLNWQTTTFGRLYTVAPEKFGWHLLGLLVGVFLLNPCADFVSLQETRWILGRSRNARFGKLCLLGVIDLAATSAIFLAMLFIFGSIYIFFSEYIEEPLSIRRVVNALFKRDQAFVFFASTFFTSALWFMYLGWTLCIRMLKRNSHVLRLILETVGESPTPARTTAGLIAIILVAVYGVVWVFI